MAMVADQQSNFKHFCRICKKGFGCGRALGGHMRAHGIGDESSQMDDDDPASDWEEKLGGNVPPINKRMYALRTNPNRLKSCRVCENCGKEFLSWKSFLEHGKCTSEGAGEEESLPSSPESEDGEERRRCGGWSKRKRSFRGKMGNYGLSEEEDLANCLVMLSHAKVDPAAAELEESCASASKDVNNANKAKAVAAKGTFECKACKKVFNSHQALGGHRASHKKVKGCFAAWLDQDPDEPRTTHSLAFDEEVITHDDYSMPSSKTLKFDRMPSKRKSKVHECSICHRVFSSGQALGGHKRCHWITSNAPETPLLTKFQSEPLDLNLPAPVDDVFGVHRDTGNPLALHVSTEIHLQPWLGVEPKGKDNNLKSDNNNNNNTITSNCSMQNGDDEADSKVKLGKLGDLKDMNMISGSSSWLQVGIVSTTDVGGDVINF